MKAPPAPVVGPAERPLRGTVRVPGDKSIAHRAAMVGAIARGPTTLLAFPDSSDCRATLAVLGGLDVGVERVDDRLTVQGRGWDGLHEPRGALDCGRSGTTMRLMSGVLAGAGVRATLTGDPQLLARPMERVAEPLRAMGAEIATTDGRPPISIEPAALAGTRYELPVASAQVKSAILLAGLRADGPTTVVEPARTRDHTERLLAWLGAPVDMSRGEVSIRAADLEGFDMAIPGDLSSAAPLLAAAAAIPGSTVAVEGVGLNPSRTAFLDLLERMGALVEVDRQDDQGPERTGVVGVRHAGLRGMQVGPDLVPGLIDELPLLGVLGALAHGETAVRGAGELRVKESDRIAGLVAGLRALGVDAEELPDGFAVRGPARPSGGEVDARGDHRLAMAFAVLAMAATGPVSVAGLERAGDSFPGFVAALESVR